MYTFFNVLFVCICVSIYVYVTEYHEGRDLPTRIFNFIIALVLGFAISLFLSAGSCSILGKLITPRTETTKIVYNIECLSDGIAVQGYSTLGSGRIDTKMMYRFYYKDNNNNICLKEVDVNNCILKYTTGKPYAVQYTKHQIETNNFDFFDINNWCFVEDYDYKIQIFVPKSGLRNSTVLDAQ
jgi:hypothetical protein